MVIKKNKRGWIKIVEAFLAILFISAVILIILNSISNKTRFENQTINQDEKNILRVIQMNNETREEIVNFENNGENAINKDNLSKTYEILDNFFNKKANIRFIGKICSINNMCILSEEEINDNSLGEKSIYSESVMISSIKNVYKPKILKIFFWEN